jgi:hypothetical protein
VLGAPISAAHDNQKLRAWIEAPPHGRRGLRLVHLHLGGIEPAAAVDREEVVGSLMALARDEAQIQPPGKPARDTFELGGGEQIQVDLNPAMPPLLRRFHVFSLSNGDIAVVYKALAWSAVDRVCKQIEDRIRARGGAIAVNPYDAAGGRSLYSILELEVHLKAVARYLDRIEAEAT